MSRLLVVDDEQSICWGLSRLGKTLGHEVVTASSAEQALAAIEDFRPDVIVLDVRLPGMDGLTALDQFRQRLGAVPVIVVTAYGNLDTAVKSFRNGAVEYIIKPFDLEQIERALARALATGDVRAGKTVAVPDTGGFVGSSTAMQEVFKRIALAAASDANVLVEGESGTGKELAARAIHQYSNRSEGPFVAVNVASLSPSLAESELFGHVQGAFTGADHHRVGLLVQADGGTLFLDEVADIPLPTQVKLLRVLDLGEVVPVGSSTPVKTNFRVVSATHRNLLEDIQNETFRHDLFFRLNAFQINIPPVRERLDDIRELAEHFLTAAACHVSTPPVLSDATLEELARRPWYGNVRELCNAVEHAVIVARGGVIMPDHLPEAFTQSGSDTASLEQSIQATMTAIVRQWTETAVNDDSETGDLYERFLGLVEPPLFQAVIERFGGQCTAAAVRLGIHRTTLRKKLDRYDAGNP